MYRVRGACGTAPIDDTPLTPHSIAPFPAREGGRGVRYFPTLSRRRIVGRAAGWVGGTGVAAFLAACGSSQNESTTGSSASPGATEEAGTPKRGGTAVMAWEADVGPMEHDRSSGQITARIRNHIYDGLFNRDYRVKDKVPPQIPALAESFEVVGQAEEYVFKLRQGVKFHDGTPVTAEAVKFSWDRQFVKEHPYYSRLAAPTNSPVTRTIERIETPDPYTARFIMKGLNVDFVDGIDSIRIANPQTIARYGIDEYPNYASGTGPWKYDRWDRGSQISIVRNNEYWGGEDLPYLDKIVIRAMPEHSARVTALQTGEVDFITVVPPDFVEPLRKAGFTVEMDLSPHIWFWYPNYKNSVIGKDKRIRNAIAYAIDRDGMVSGLLKDTATPAYEYWGPAAPYYTPLPEDQRFKYNLAKAKQLLAEAGYPNGFTIKWGIPVTGSGMMVPVPMNEFIQQNLKAAGINVQFDVMEWQRYLDWERNGYDADYGGGNQTHTAGETMRGIFTTFHSSHGTRAGWGANAEIDRMLEAGSRVLDEEERMRKYYIPAHNLAVDDGWVIPVVHDKIPLAWNAKRLKNMRKIRSWYFDMIRIWKV